MRSGSGTRSKSSLPAEDPHPDFTEALAFDEEEIVELERPDQLEVQPGDKTPFVTIFGDDTIMVEDDDQENSILLDTQSALLLRDKLNWAVLELLRRA